MVVAYFKDPSLPLIGTRNGLAMLAFILPRLIPALIVAGLFQILVPQEVVSRHFGREAGLRGLLIATGAAEACIAVNNAVHWINPKAKVNPGHSSNMALFGQKDD